MINFDKDHPHNADVRALQAAYLCAALYALSESRNREIKLCRSFPRCAERRMRAAL
jgi:hypothetical protein